MTIYYQHLPTPKVLKTYKITLKLPAASSKQASIEEETKQTTMSTTTTEDYPKTQRRRRVIELMHLAAAKAIREEDPWSSFDTKAVAAERVIRHLYDPVTQTWSTDETIAKMEPKPFTHGAMRFCYRLKKRATPPKSSTNHRFHRSGWQLASNYVAKAYQKDGEVDTSLEAKQAIQNDILLQYEAQHCKLYWQRLKI